MPKEVADGVFLIDTVALGDPGTVASYLILRRRKAIVDLGYASSFNTLLREIREKGVGAEDLNYILVTHVHMDHCGGAGHMAKAAQNATIVAHRRASKHLVDPSRLKASVRQVYGDEVYRLFGDMLPTPRERTLFAEDGYETDLGEEPIILLYTPGHAWHHASFWMPDSKILFTGDAVGIRYRDFPTLIPTTPPPSFDLDYAVESLQRLRRLGARLLMTPHFGVFKATPSFFEEEIDGMKKWVEMVSKYREEGLDPGAIIERMKEHVAAKAGVSVEELPHYAVGSITLSTMGAIGYIERREKEA